MAKNERQKPTIIDEKLKLIRKTIFRLIHDPKILSFDYQCEAIKKYIEDESKGIEYIRLKTREGTNIFLVSTENTLEPTVIAPQWLKRRMSCMEAYNGEN